MLCLCSEEEEGFSRFFFSSICWLRMEWKRERRSGDAQNEFIYYISSTNFVLPLLNKNKVDSFWWVQWLSFQCAPMHNLWLFCLLTQCTSTFPFPYLFRGLEKTGAKKGCQSYRIPKTPIFRHDLGWKMEEEARYSRVDPSNGTLWHRCDMNE